MQNAEQKTALIAMSGGVDSSIAAYLMRQADFRCMGTTMRLYRNEDLGACNFRTCCSEKDIEDASEVAFQLDIPYEVLDFTLDFQEKIIGKFVRTYEAGGTPNPCIDCNRFMKFDKLLDFAEQHGLYYVVTGHYARIEQDEQTGRWLLKKGVDAGKDQSYVLYTMTQRQLAHTKFPLGDRNKPEIRELAEQLSFCNARKHDSQDICFVPDHDYASFIEEESDTKCMPGNFILEDGEVVGKHKGITHYTIGQRKGLGVTFGKPMFVKEIKADTNEIVLCENDALFTKEVIVENVNYMAVESINEPVRLVGKIRYSHKGAPCVVEAIDQNTIKCTFDEPQRAVTPGQAAVFYMDDYVYCGGVIK